MTKRVILIVICVSLLIFAHYNYYYFVISDSSELTKQPKPILTFYKNHKPIWISMALCHDKKAQIFSTDHVPHKIKFKKRRPA